MRLGYNFKDYASTYTLSDDRPIPSHHRAEHDYAVSKTEADRLVRAANGQQGLITGVVSAFVNRHEGCSRNAHAVSL